MAPPAAWTPTLAQSALIVAKSTLLLGIAALGAYALRRGSAAARHLVWTLAMGGLVALPALVFLLPDWKPAALAILRPVAEGAAAVAPAAVHLSLETALLAAWAVGAAVVLARLVRGLRATSRMARTAEQVVDPAWTDLLERHARAVGVRRAVVLLRSPEAAMPLTWGAFRPVILLPAEADAWPAERRSVVLLHELAHVARRDCLMQTLAEVCCAAWWFHPGAWWAARRMRIEREQACDDRVLAAGARASDYAGHLLDVARTYRAPALAAAIAMARPSHLEGRVLAVLAAERDRRAVTRRTAAVCACAVLLATLPLAAVAPSHRVAPANTVAWEMPPPRTFAFRTSDASAPSRSALGSGPIHGTWEWIPSPVAAAAPRPTVADQPAEAPPHAAPAKHEERTERRALAEHDAAKAHAHGGRARSTPSPSPTLVASLDSDGRLSARVRIPEGMDVRIEGHGVRTVGNELRMDVNVVRAITSLARVAQTAEKCPGTARPRSAGSGKKVASDVRRAASEQKHQLALRILDDLNADVVGEVRGGKDEARERNAGGA